MGSLPVHSAALLSGDATAAHHGLRVLSRSGASARGSKTPQRLASAPCLRTPRPRSFPCRRLGGSAASHSPRSSHCPGLGGSSARSKRARHRGTRSSEGDSARLAPRLASRSLAVVLASPPGTRAPRAAATAAHQEPSDGREYGCLQQPVFRRWYARGVARWWLWRVRDGARRGGRLPRTRDRGARRGAVRGARQVSDVRESCGLVGLGNVLHTFESGFTALAWGMRCVSDSYGFRVRL